MGPSVALRKADHQERDSRVSPLVSTCDARADAAAIGACLLYVRVLHQIREVRNHRRL